MDHADWERAAAVYVPLAAAIIARLLYGRQPRQFAACSASCGRYRRCSFFNA